jgi:chromate transport protein ChrA
VGAGAVVVVVFFTFAAFVAFVFFVFFSVVFGASVVAGASCANTGIASENATAKVNSNTKSFFMLGLDLLMIFFPFCLEQGVGHFSAIALDSAKQLKYQKL